MFLFDMYQYKSVILIVGLVLGIQLANVQSAPQDDLARLKFRVEGLMAGQADNSMKLVRFQEFQSSAEAGGEANLDALRVAQEDTHVVHRSKINAMYAESDEKLRSLQVAQAEDHANRQTIQRKIDELAEQTSALTKQLIAYFTTQPSTTNNTGVATDESRRVNILKLEGGGGATYIRWGRTSCSGSIETVTKVYEGYAGNSWYNAYSSYAGNSGGTNFLCLHNTPVLKTSIAAISARGSIRGVQYYFANNPFSTTNSGGLTLLGMDMPCVACNAETKSSYVMIPARSNCPAGWDLEYWGYLVTSYTGSNFAKSSYICLDNGPEVIAASVADSQSNYASPVGGFCGSTFPCPPYVTNLAVPCVVCSI